MFLRKIKDLNNFISLYSNLHELFKIKNLNINYFDLNMQNNQEAKLKNKLYFLNNIELLESLSNKSENINKNTISNKFNYLLPIFQNDLTSSEFIQFKNYNININKENKIIFTKNFKNNNLKSSFFEQKKISVQPNLNNSNFNYKVKSFSTNSTNSTNKNIENKIKINLYGLDLKNNVKNKSDNQLLGQPIKLNQPLLKKSVPITSTINVGLIQPQNLKKKISLIKNKLNIESISSPVRINKHKLIFEYIDKITNFDIKIQQSYDTNNSFFFNKLNNFGKLSIPNTKNLTIFIHSLFNKFLILIDNPLFQITPEKIVLNLSYLFVSLSYKTKKKLGFRLKTKYYDKKNIKSPNRNYKKSINNIFLNKQKYFYNLSLYMINKINNLTKKNKIYNLNLLNKILDTLKFLNSNNIIIDQQFLNPLKQKNLKLTSQTTKEKTLLKKRINRGKAEKTAFLINKLNFINRNKNIKKLKKYIEYIRFNKKKNKNERNKNSKFIYFNVIYQFLNLFKKLSPLNKYDISWVYSQKVKYDKVKKVQLQKKNFNLKLVNQINFDTNNFSKNLMNNLKFIKILKYRIKNFNKQYWALNNSFYYKNLKFENNFLNWPDRPENKMLLKKMFNLNKIGYDYNNFNSVKLNKFNKPMFFNIKTEALNQTYISNGIGISSEQSIGHQALQTMAVAHTQNTAPLSFTSTNDVLQDRKFKYWNNIFINWLFKKIDAKENSTLNYNNWIVEIQIILYNIIYILNKTKPFKNQILELIFKKVLFSLILIKLELVKNSISIKNVNCSDNFTKKKNYFIKKHLLLLKFKTNKLLIKYFNNLYLNILNSTNLPSRPEFTKKNNLNYTNSNLYLQSEKKKIKLINKISQILINILQYFFKRPVFIDLTRIFSPLNNIEILIQLIDKAINKIRYLKIRSSLFNSAFNSLRYRTINRKNMDLVPSSIKGLHIKIGGRLITEPIKPRISVKLFKKGIFNKTHILTTYKASLSNKNKRGAYTINLKTSENLIKF